MEINKFAGKLRNLAEKYKFAIMIFIIGLALLLIPDNRQRQQEIENPAPTNIKDSSMQDSLTQILQSIEGAGKVKVLLSMSTGEETIYQTDSEISGSGETGEELVKTVITTTSERDEAGLIRQVNPAAYKGAIIVCQGADSPTVRLAVTQAVSKITGLGIDAICVLKMQ